MAPAVAVDAAEDERDRHVGDTLVDPEAVDHAVRMDRDLGNVRLVLAHRVEGWLAAGFGEPRAVVVAGVERGVLVPFDDLGQVVGQHAFGAGFAHLCQDFVPAFFDARCGFA